MDFKQRKFKLLSIFLICFFLIFTDFSTVILASSSGTSVNRRFRYDYGVFLSINDSKMNRLKDYQTVVIDASAFSKKNIQKLKKRGHTVYTYLNIGSLEDFRSDYETYLPYTLEVYKNWENERWADVSHKEWQNRIASWAKKYSDKGVDGFFIDNCDVYYAMGLDLDGKPEQKVTSAKLFKGLTTILRNLRKTHKNKDVIINGGVTFIQSCMKKKYNLTKYFTGVNAETVYTKIDFKNNKLKKASASNRKAELKYLNSLPKSIERFVIEYTTSKSLIKTIHKDFKKYGIRYYIADTIKLN